MADTPPVLELKQVSKWFRTGDHNGRVEAVESVSLTVAHSDAGEFVSFLGPSGCGKSTLLNLISGLLQPSEGDILIAGTPLHGLNPLSVTVPQAYTCYPWLSVSANVEFGLGIQGVAPAVRRKTAQEYLERVGLGDRGSASPKQLSGGMQQRVAIARTLAMKPPMMLMDEPFGALDAQTRSEMQQLLMRLWSEEKNAVFFVTHDITEALLLSDRIIVFSARPAKVIHDLAVPFTRPRDPSLVYESSFVELTHALMQFLRQAPGSGQVAASV